MEENIGTTQDIKKQRDLVCLKEWLPEAEFYQEFNNTVRSHKTLLCFGLNKVGKIIWDLWGYTFNDPGSSHAEKMVIRVLSDFFSPQQLCEAPRYQLTMYLSYSPCDRCCQDLIDFVQLINVVNVDVMVSRLYYPEEPTVRHMLRQLVGSGVRLKVMGTEDFQQCFSLFVSLHSMFEAWPELDAMSKNYSELLHAVVHQRGDDSDTESGESERSPRLLLLDGGDSWGPQGPRTPQKERVLSDSQRKQEGWPVKRKLF